MCMCGFICLSVHSHASKNTCPNFMKSSVHVTCGTGSFLLWQQCNTLRTSGHVDNVIFSHNGRQWTEATEAILRPAHHLLLLLSRWFAIIRQVVALRCSNRGAESVVDLIALFNCHCWFYSSVLQSAAASQLAVMCAVGADWCDDRKHCTVLWESRQFSHQPDWKEQRVSIGHYLLN